MKRGRAFQERVSAACEKGNHAQCIMQKCTCTLCHNHSKAELIRSQGLRTVAKPGDPDFKDGPVPGITMAPFCICDGVDTSGCPFHGEKVTEDAKSS